MVCSHFLGGSGVSPGNIITSPIYRSDNVAFSEMIMYHRRESTPTGSEGEGGARIRMIRAVRPEDERRTL